MLHNIINITSFYRPQLNSLNEWQKIKARTEPESHMSLSQIRLQNLYQRFHRGIFSQIRQFQMVKFLKQVQYYKISLWRHRQTKAFYLIKQAKITQQCYPHLYRESKILWQVTHPNILTFWDAFIDQNAVFMVFSTYWEDLPAFIKEQTKNEGKRHQRMNIHIIQEIILAIKHIHSKGLAFKNLKPENIVITQSGEAKLFDFSSLDYVQHHHNIRRAFCISTPYQILPGGQLKMKVDIYALAKIIYLCTRHTCLSPERKEECLEAIKDPSLRKLLQEMLQADQFQRPNTDKILQFQWMKNRKSDQPRFQKLQKTSEKGGEEKKKQLQAYDVQIVYPEFGKRKQGNRYIQRIISDFANKIVSNLIEFEEDAIMPKDEFFERIIRRWPTEYRIIEENDRQTSLIRSIRWAMRRKTQYFGFPQVVFDQRDRAYKGCRFKY